MIVAFLAVSSVVFAPVADQGQVSASVHLVDGDSVTMAYHVDPARYELNMTAVIVETMRDHQGPVYVLINDNMAFWCKVRLQRLADHLNNELPNFGSKLTARVISSEDLPMVFSDHEATLVCGPSTDLPDYYAVPAKDWVTKGGLWVGIGNGSAPFVYARTNAGAPNATLRLDFDTLDYRDGNDRTVSPLASALGFQYVAPQQGFLVEELKALGGRSIGYEYDRGETLGTAGIVPLGAGALLVLGGNMDPPPLAGGEDVLAWDLEKILMFDVPWWTGNLAYEFRSATNAPIDSQIALAVQGGNYACYGVLSHSDAVHAFYLGRVQY